MNCFWNSQQSNEAKSNSPKAFDKIHNTMHIPFTRIMKIKQKRSIPVQVENNIFQYDLHQRNQIYPQPDYMLHALKFPSCFCRMHCKENSQKSAQ